MFSQSTITLPEQQEEVRVCPVSPSYSVSENGVVTRIDTGRVKSQYVAKRGAYLIVSLWEKGKERMWPVHQLVAFTFHGLRPTPRHHAAHDDGNKNNNHRSNIMWKTKEENEADKIKHGRTNRGERNGMSKLTNDQVRSALDKLSSGWTQLAVANYYGLTQGAVSNIKRGVRNANI